MKTEINKLKVVFEGRTLEIDIQKELSINENLLNSQLKDSPSSYYILASLRDKYIKQRDALAREKRQTFLLNAEVSQYNGQDVYLKMEEQIEGTNQYKLYKSYTFRMMIAFSSDFDF